MEPTEQNRLAWDEVHRRRMRAAGQGIPKQIRELLGDVEGKHVLHLVSGSGEMTEELVELGALVTGVELSSEAIEAARERFPDLAYIHADINELPVEVRRSRFDLVLAGEALDLVRDLDQWLTGVASALKPGGTFLLYDHHPVTAAVDALGHWRDNYFEEPRWRLEQIVDAVMTAGLRVVRLAEFQSLYNWIQRDRRIPWEFALIAEKPQ
jgi:ubiquinone/menaquinone biosynthesis C-methylase UbiE